MYVYVYGQIPERHLRQEHSQLIDGYCKSALDLDTQGKGVQLNIPRLHSTIHVCTQMYMYMCMCILVQCFKGTCKEYQHTRNRMQFNTRANPNN